MIRVLFVCLGNICRSPMAEAVFRHKVKERGLEQTIDIDSAGTGDWHIGQPPHEGTCRLLVEKHIDCAGMVARPVRKDDLTSADYLIAMDRDNLRALKRMGRGKATGKIALLLDFVPGKEGTDVPDPYYTGNFEEVFDLVDEGCERLLKHIQERER